MSRRKQSNPKPLKLSAECPSDSQSKNQIAVTGDNDSDDITDKETKHQDDVRSDNGEDDEDDQEPKPKRIKIKQERDTDSIPPDYEIQNGYREASLQNNVSSNNSNQVVPTSPNCMMEGLLSHLQLPSDVLHLKRIEVNVDNNPTYGWVVCSGIPLPKGSSLGPFQGEIISTEKVQMGDLILQFTSSGGKQAFVNVSNQSGAWLTLLRQSTDSSCCNTQVHLNGGRIWCQVESDLDIGSELIASFTFHVEGEDEIRNKSPDSNQDEQCSSPVISKVSQPIITQPSSKPTSTSGHAALIFGCPFCGVRFSSPRTLEGHIAFYCSRKPPSQPQQESNQEDSTEPIKLETVPEENEEEVEKESRAMKRSADDDSNSSIETPVAKFPRPEQISYQCTSCSYTADKISSLNRHRRIHNRPPQSPQSPQPSQSMVSADTYCQQCNIQFSSFNTFKAHKEFYCSQRAPKPLKNLEIRTEQNSDDSSQSSVSPQISSADQHRVLSPRNQLLMSSKTRLPASVNGTSPVLAEQTVIYTPVVGADGKPNMMPTLLVQPVVSVPRLPELPNVKAAHCHDKDRSVSPASTSNSTTEDQPLDLTTPKPLKVKPKTPKSPLKSESPNKERISPLSDLSSKSSSPPRTASIQSTMISPLPPPAFLSNVMPNFFPFSLNPSTSAISLPNPGVSKCTDCNIVFYKRENYLIHRQHYCSGKKIAQQQSPPPAVSEVKQQLKSPKKTNTTSTSNSSDKTTTNDIIDDITYRYFCVPCKIKFSSVSTLSAHKEFYCPHGKDSEKTMVAQPPSVGDITEENQVKSSPELESIDLQCDQCDNTFASLRLLKLHICSLDKSKLSFLRCAHCDYVTQTETRMTDHMKVHAPTRSFRCTICGYRGNTIRGMRMHGKTHIDNGEDFTDDNMLEYREPPLVPIDSNGHNVAASHLDLESELLRIKNEPYKRRRSRKSFEKSENMGLQIQQCSVCGETFANSNYLSVHMKTHSVSATCTKAKLECEQCDFIGKTVKDLACHQAQHDDVNDSGQENTDPNSTPSPTPPSPRPVPISIKQEVMDKDYELAIKKIETLSEETKESSATESLPVIKQEAKEIMLSPSAKNPKESPTRPKSVELSSEMCNGDVGPTSENMLPYLIIPNTSSLSSPVLLSAPSLPQGPKYCRNCDISFTYLSSFLAHKKYYCTAKAPEKVSPSASA
ncbi:hypothetical protein SNE40_007054 [Patella caerulea]|uniref:Zinc finger protein ush n=1 Tax=Patella caerulea TaxID=87958 RepID=A0AAN8JX56_PATCE